MASGLERGFKTAAERLALSIRTEFGIGRLDRVDCCALCAQLGVPIISVHELLSAGASARSIGCLTADNARFSAMTVASGSRRLIVFNPLHPPGRMANSVAHELSHILLEHPLVPVLGPGGCRQWDATREAEADWQAGAILVPRDSALLWMQRNGSLEDGADHFGVSTALFRWRVNQTGITKQLAAVASSRRG